jgi:hypothetical protein
MSEDHKEEAQKIQTLLNKLRADHTREVDTQEINGTWHTIEYCVTCSDYEDIPDWPCSTLLMLDNYEALIELVAHIRPEVLEFAGEMEDKLRKHDRDKDGWKIDLGKGDAKDLLDLLYKLGQHQIKLHKLLFYNSYRGDTFKDITPEFLDNVVSSAADVANFAMMIADNARGWKELLRESEGDSC